MAHRPRRLGAREGPQPRSPGPGARACPGTAGVHRGQGAEELPPPRMHAAAAAAGISPLRLRVSLFPQARWRPGDQSGEGSEGVAREPGWRGKDPGAAAEVCLREVAAGQGLSLRRSWGEGRDCRSLPRG